jgi:hypothetical protein
VPIEVGTRWGAEFARQGEELFATELKPRTEPSADPTELKGRLASLTGQDFRIQGIRALYDERSERQHETTGSAPELAEGLLVKVRGPVLDGVLHAQHIKFYPPSEPDTQEMRGLVQSVEQVHGRGRLVLGGFALRFGPETDLKDAHRRRKHTHLERERIAQLLEDGQAGDFELERSVYDLIDDPRERTPMTEHSLLDGRLDKLGAALVRKRIFSASDRKELSPQDLQDLQDIGYAGASGER